MSCTWEAFEAKRLWHRVQDSGLRMWGYSFGFEVSDLVFAKIIPSMLQTHMSSPNLGSEFVTFRKALHNQPHEVERAKWRRAALCDNPDIESMKPAPAPYTLRIHSSQDDFRQGSGIHTATRNEKNDSMRCQDGRPTLTS